MDTVCCIEVLHFECIPLPGGTTPAGHTQPFSALLDLYNPGCTDSRESAQRVIRGFCSACFTKWVQLHPVGRQRAWRRLELPARDFPSTIFRYCQEDQHALSGIVGTPGTGEPTVRHDVVFCDMLWSSFPYVRQSTSPRVSPLQTFDVVDQYFFPPTNSKTQCEAKAVKEIAEQELQAVAARVSTQQLPSTHLPVLLSICGAHRT